MTEIGWDYKLLLPDAQIKTSGFDNRYKINGKVIHVYPTTYNVPTSLTGKLIYLIKKLVKKVLFRRKTRNEFKEADYILNIGQGDSFSDIYGEKHFHHINLASKLSQYYNKPYCILPQTIGPFTKPEVEASAVKSIQKAKIVMARDKQSFDYTKKIAHTANIKEYIDVAFFLPYSTIKHSEGKIHVGLNVSALLWNGGYTKNNQFSLNCDYQTLIRSIIEYFLSINNAIIHLVAHVVEPDPKIENDYEVVYNIWREYNDERVVLAPFALSPVDIKSYIAGLDFFMGARMHATIAAFSTGVPVVPMAYSRKFNGLFNDTLSYNHVIDMKLTSGVDALNTIKDAFIHREDLKKEIKVQDSTTVKERGILLREDLKSFFQNNAR